MNRVGKDLFFCRFDKKHWQKKKTLKTCNVLPLYHSEDTDIKVFTHCCPKINQLPGISTARMSLFVISRELQFGVCNHSKPCAMSCMAREEHSYGEGKEAGRAIVTKKKNKGKRVPGFSLTWVLARKEVFLVKLYYYFRVWELPLLVSWLFNWGFCLLISYKLKLQFMFPHTGDQEVELTVPTLVCLVLLATNPHP